MATTIRSFARPDSLGFILRGTVVLLGEIEEGAKTGDLKIQGCVRDDYLRVVRFDGVAWRDVGGRYNGHQHKMRLGHAERVCVALRALGVHEYFLTAAALLAADAKARFVEQQQRELAAKQHKAQA